MGITINFLRKRRLFKTGQNIRRNRCPKKGSANILEVQDETLKGRCVAYKRGTAKTGKRGRGGKVKSRKQAIAIGLAKARKKGKRVPRKKS